jgi:hypothetical protein
VRAQGRRRPKRPEGRFAADTPPAATKPVGDNTALIRWAARRMFAIMSEAITSPNIHEKRAAQLMEATSPAEFRAPITASGPLGASRQAVNIRIN